MSTVQPEPASGREAWKPPVGERVRRHAGARYESLKAEARRRRLVANAIVVGSTAAVLALAAVFNALLSR
jgi:hypothetical protein